MPKKSKEVEVIEVNATSEFEAKLAGSGLLDLLKSCDEYTDIDVTRSSTGFPSLDRALNEEDPGMPDHRHVEVFSQDESAGKTSLTLAIGAFGQSQGKSVGIIDLEKTITKDYLQIHKFVLDAKEDPTKIAVRMMRPSLDDDSDESYNIYLENTLDAIKKAANLFDILIIDSVDALVSEEESEKSSADNKKMGGISKKLSEFFRDNTNTKATIYWINQMRMVIGAWSPSGAVQYTTSGGKALRFYASIRIKLVVVEKLIEGEGKDPYGFRAKLTIVKNKTGAPWRTTDLYYINGEGFSRIYDYFITAKREGYIIKKGAWYTFADKDGTELLKAQGELKTYTLIKSDLSLLTKMISLVDHTNNTVEEVAPEEIVYADESAE